jgi:phage recombination protein Bet
VNAEASVVEGKSLVEAKEPQLPAPVARRGIDEASWRTAMNNLFPGARPESVLMVFDYCKARKLDPLKKPCHIVPMQVRGDNGEYYWRDVVMPGIYEYRTTANRTGEYLGHSKPEYGPTIEHMGVKAPEWCDFVAYRWNPEAKMRAEFPVQIKFSESVGTTWDKKAGEHKVNSRWTKAPQQMLTKCAEAAALREAFPDELGGTHTVEEMEGQRITDDPIEAEKKPLPKIDPRGDLSGVDWEMRDKHVNSVTDILNADLDEFAIAEKLRQYVNAHLNPEPELYMAVNDELAKRGIISKANFRKYISLVLEVNVP